MSLINEGALRALIAEEMRKVVREEIGRQPRRDEYLPVAAAAAVAAVVPDTIRSWIRQGRLTAHWAGRELRVLRSELDRLLATPPATDGESTPEEEARRYLRRRGETPGQPPGHGRRGPDGAEESPSESRAGSGRKPGPQNER